MLWTPGTRSRVWLWTLGIWLLSLVTPGALTLSMGWLLPPGLLITLLLALHVSFVLPTQPGLLGVVQYICVLILPLHGIDSTAAFAYGLLLNAVMVIPQVTSGLVMWMVAIRQPPTRTPRFSR